MDGYRRERFTANGHIAVKRHSSAQLLNHSLPNDRPRLSQSWADWLVLRQADFAMYAPSHGKSRSKSPPTTRLLRRTNAQARLEAVSCPRMRPALA
jgi:hypothetical protein